jgi:hypothetical protein
MDSLPPSSTEDLVPAIVACKREINRDRARALHAAREYRLDPTPERLEDVVAAQVLLSYRNDDMAALLVELARRMRRHH